MHRKAFKFIGIIAVALMLSQLVSCAGKRTVTARDPKRYIQEHDLTHLPKFDVPVEMNDRVVAWLEYFQGPGRGHFKRYLERSGRYMPLMQEILRKEGLPRDLVYVSLIESGFNVNARSYANAIGAWQFMNYTGRDMGLKIDGWVDERRDPIRATAAAANYFKDLYNQFGDWYLAITSYNAGPGRVQRAIDTTGTRDFWTLSENRKVLLPEQRDYVPKFIAAAIIAKMPERFGFNDIDYKEPLSFERGVVETQTDVSMIAKCSGASEDDIMELNPHLVRGATPPGVTDYEIRLPQGTSKIFREKYASLPKEERIQIVRYEVRKGDTLARVARRFGVPASAIASANGISGSSRRGLSRGTTLTIPTGSAAARFAAADESGRDNTGNKKQIRHTVKRGETLSTIARRYGVSQKQIMAWNSIRKSKNVHAGMRLTIKKARGGVSSDEVDDSRTAKMEHAVKPGDTLSTIARRYGVTVKQLMALNDLGSANDVRSGMKLVIRRAKVPRATEDLDVGGETVVVKKEHKVVRGDTLSTIARRYGVTTKQLMAMNNIKNAKSVRAGMNIVIEKPSKRKAAPAEDVAATPKQKSSQIASMVPNAVPPAQMTSVEPKVNSELVAPQSLSDNLAIAVPESNQEPVTTAVKLSEAAPQGKGNISKELKKPISAEADMGKAITYKVKDGDTLWDIARRHKVTIAEIQRWNNLSDPSAVRPGSTLKIKKN